MGKICPVCEKDIGFWAVFFAAMPSRIRCRHCKSLLLYEHAGVVVATLIALLLTSAAGAFFFLTRFYSPSQPQIYFLWAGLAVVLWLPLELAVTFYLRRVKVLRKSEQRSR